MRLQPTLLICFMLPLASLLSQNQYYYPLTSNFNEATASGPPLVALANGAGQTGQFMTNAFPPSTCSGLGTIGGYEYADNAGLRFDVPLGTVGCEYSILFTWRYDNPMGAQEWIRVLSFIYSDDSGIEIWTQPPALNGTLYYWDLDPFLVFPGFCLAQPTFGALGPAQQFNPINYYRVGLTRTCNDVLNVYVDGTFAGTYTDVDQKYLPQAPDNQIVFFRDTFDTSCYPTPFPGEASSGFISNLLIADTAFSAAQIQADFDTLCPVLLGLEWVELRGESDAQGNHLHGTVDQPDWVAHYEVIRTVEGEFPQVIGRVGEQEFRFTDPLPVGAEQTYQIWAYTDNGQVFKSPFVSLRPHMERKVFPTPAVEEVKIWVPASQIGEWVRVYSMVGQQSKTIQLSSSLTVVELNDWPAGLLFVQFSDGTIKKIFKRK